MPDTSPVRRRWPTIQRDSIIWLLGIGFSINEMIFEPKIRPEALVFCGMLLGLPGILRVTDVLRRVVADADAAEKGAK